METCPSTVSNRRELRLAGTRKRHYTFARRHWARYHGPGRNGSNVFNTLIYRENFADSKAAMPRPAMGRGEAGAVAPFVYRLGRHPFTVERAVRFR